MIVWHVARHERADGRDDPARHKVLAHAHRVQRDPRPLGDVDVLEVPRHTPAGPRPEGEVGAVGHVEAAQAGAALEEQLDARAVQAAQPVRAEGGEAGQPLGEEAEGLLRVRVRVRVGVRVRVRVRGRVRVRVLTSENS